MTKKGNELEKRRLDLQLDDELRHTFPASDAPKITRTPHNRFTKPMPAQVIATSRLLPFILRHDRDLTEGQSKKTN